LTTWNVRSTRNVPGAITVVPGDPVHVDLPELPPVAEVYPEAPPAEAANGRFELVPRGLIDPDTRRAEVDLFISSDVQSTRCAARITFPAERASVDEVRWVTRQGATTIDDERGHVVLALLDSVRRLGAEGERVHVATLDVLVDESDPLDEPIELR